MKILVTGGAGFIGSNFIYLLFEERPDWDVLCVDALTYAANFHTLNKAFNNSNFKFYREDIRNRDGIFRFFRKRNQILLLILLLNHTLIEVLKILVFF